MRRVLSAALLVALTAGPARPQSAPAQTEPDLQAGIKQVNDGDLAGGVFALEAVIRRLALEHALHAKELSQAYLYRGVAFVGLGQEENAKGSFAAALQYNKELRIGEDKFPPRVVRVFEAARLGKTRSVLLPPSGVAKKAGIGALGVAGIVAGTLAVAGGAAVAARGGSNAVQPPAGSFTVSPSGPALVGATVMTFTASANDPGGNTPITYQWNFGDGMTGSGQTVTHVFSFPGQPAPGGAGREVTVVLTVQNSKGAQSTTSSNVTAKSLSGHWVFVSPSSGCGRFYNFLDLAQTGSAFTGQGPPLGESPRCQPGVTTVTSGLVEDPRNLSFDYNYPSACYGGPDHLSGSLDATLDHMNVSNCGFTRASP